MIQPIVPRSNRELTSDEEIRKLVLARLQVISSDTIKCIGSDGSFNRDQLIEHVKLGDNIANADGSEANAGALTDDKCSINLGNTESGDSLCYYASSGAYATDKDPRADAEGYVPIVYGDRFSRNFYNDAEIIAPSQAVGGGLLSIGGVDYWAGNVLTPGSEIAMTFKLGLPEPCVGSFESGDIFFWGEAI